MSRMIRWALTLSFCLVTYVAPALADQSSERLNNLFDELRHTDSLVKAKQTEGQIWSIWLNHDDSDVRKAMAKGLASMRSGDYASAYDAFSTAIEINDNFAEAWNKRATVLYLAGNLDDSVADIIETLKREPRHFGALSGLSLIYQQQGRPEAAIGPLEAGIEIYPLMPGAEERLNTLRTELEKLSPET